jgi:DNA helicase HerA-like ATPase
LGQTGSGKTTLAKYLCAVRPYVVVLDPKGLIFWPGYERHETLESLTKSDKPRLIYRPIYSELSDPEMMDVFFEWIYQRKNTALYVDEIYAVAKGDVYPPHLGACLTRGRERNVVVYVASQRPSRIPQITLSESEHVYCFRLKLPKDRDRVSELTGLDPEALRLPGHQFYYAPQAGEPSGPLVLKLAA